MGEDLKSFGDKMRVMKEEMENTAKAQGKRVIKDALKAILDAFPEVTKLKWRQYTPFFNDGDACVFGVNNIEAFFGKHNEEDDEDDEDGLDSSSLLYESKDGPESLKSLHSRLSKVLKEFDDTAQQMEEAFLFAFGDHVEVSVSRNGEVVINEYSHD